MEKRIKEAKLKTLNMFKDISPDDTDYQMWEKIAAYMDGETALVVESGAEEGKYMLLALKNEEKNRELHYMMEQDSSIGLYIDDREEFDTDWDNGDYAPDGCYYLGSENVEILEGEG